MSSSDAADTGVPPGHAGVAPSVWPATVAALAVAAAMYGEGAWTRRSAIAWMIGSWGARLAVQATYARTPELPRLTSYWQLALSVLPFTLPALVAARNTDPALSPLEIGAALVWVIAFAGETTADRQRLRFLSTAESAAMACRVGVWRRLRHAHAVFEVIIWLAIAVFAAASPWGWLAFAAVAARLYLLTRPW
jgi:steroid 5-alpha reductase family enzyme